MPRTLVVEKDNLGRLVDAVQGAMPREGGPIVFVDRTAGPSKMSRKIFIEAIGGVWKLRFDAARGGLP